MLPPSPPPLITVTDVPTSVGGVSAIAGTVIASMAITAIAIAKSFFTFLTPCFEILAWIVCFG
jgi:hypothetical protein